MDSVQFNALSALSVRENKNLKSVALAPKNVVTYIYPHEGNGAIIGFNLSTNKEQWPAVERAIRLKSPCLTGPVNLIEGGKGFINRTPIFFTNTTSGEQEYWGMVSTIADVYSIFSEVKHNSCQNLTYVLNTDGIAFFGDSTILNNKTVEVELNMLNNKWTLHAMPRNGWKSMSIFTSSYFWSGLVFTMLICTLVITLLRNNYMEKKINLSLAKEIAERKRIEVELNVAKEQAEKANNDKSIFLADMSHEIRSPMNSIQGFTDIIMERGLSIPSAMEYVEIINNSTKRLLTIINDAIDVSMIDAGKMKLFAEPTSLNKILNQVKRLNQVNASKNSNKIRTKYSLPNGADIANVDANRLTQVINNLVTNALKFTKNGSVTLSYEIANNMLKFYVEDTGVGIPMEQGYSIFERYTQVNGKVSSAIGGAGLGLAICKMIVEKMGGTIGYKSEMGVGSKFYFTIPYDVPSDILTAQKDNKTMELLDLMGKTILIADDEASNRALFSAMFKPTNATLLMANSGQQAIDIVSKGQQIDLILMDIKMFGMDGYEATRHIREINKDVPIIAQTAYVAGENRQKSIDAGCNFYITKPIDINNLFELIRGIIH